MNKTIDKNLIKGAIFDMDGVVLDSMPYWRDLPYEFVKSKGFVPDPDIIKVVYSMSLEQGVSYMNEFYNMGISDKQLLKEMADYMMHPYANLIELKPGVINVLSRLNELGIPCIVATSSPRPHITAALKRNGILDYFEAILTSGEIGNSKHEPTIYLKAAELIGTIPENTLVFEDSHYALMTAKKAGFVTIGVSEPIGAYFRDKMLADADYFYDTLEDFEL